jgi:hypothetical protein
MSIHCYAPAVCAGIDVCASLLLVAADAAGHLSAMLVPQLQQCC